MTLTDDDAIIRDLLRMARRLRGTVGRIEVGDHIERLQRAGMTPPQWAKSVIGLLYSWQRGSNPAMLAWRQPDGIR